jgi:hypothetical protein
VGPEQVAMHDPAQMGRVKGAGEHLHQLRRRAGRQRGAAEFLDQAAPCDVLRAEVGPPVRFADLVDLHDMRML